MIILILAQIEVKSILDGIVFFLVVKERPQEAPFMT